MGNKMKKLAAIARDSEPVIVKLTRDAKYYSLEPLNDIEHILSSSKLSSTDGFETKVLSMIHRFSNDYSTYVMSAKGSEFVVQGFHIKAVNKKNAVKRIRKLLGQNNLGPDTTLEQLRDVAELFEQTKK